MRRDYRKTSTVSTSPPLPLSSLYTTESPTEPQRLEVFPSLGFVGYGESVCPVSRRPVLEHEIFLWVDVCGFVFLKQRKKKVRVFFQKTFTLVTNSRTFDFFLLTRLLAGVRSTSIPDTRDTVLTRPSFLSSLLLVPETGT